MNLLQMSEKIYKARTSSAVLNRGTFNWRQHVCDQTYLSPHDCAQTRLCPHTFVLRHVSAQTCLCPDMFVPRHVCAHTRLCPHTIVSTHVCSQSCLCPDRFVPTHVCALTCYNRVVTIMSGQKGVRLCPDTYLVP